MRVPNFCICLSNLEHRVYEILILFFPTGHEEENPVYGKKIGILKTEYKQNAHIKATSKVVHENENMAQMQEKLVFECHFCPLKFYGEKGKDYLECHLDFNHNAQLGQSISEDYGDLELNQNLVKPIVPVPCLEIDGVLQPILNSDGKLLPPSEFAESEFSQQITSIYEEERKLNKNIILDTSSRIELETDANTNILSIQDHEK